MRACRIALAVALALPAVADAAVRLRARPIFPAVRQGDAALVEVELLAEGAAPPDVVVTLRCERAGPTRSTTTAVELGAGARKTVRLALVADSPWLAVEASERGQVIAQARVEVECTTRRAFVLSLGAPPPELSRRLRRSQLATLGEVAPADLPTDPRLLPTADVMLWAAPRRAELDAGQALALRRWIVAGGTLVAGVDAAEPRALVELGLAADLPPAGAPRHVGAGRLLVVDRDLRDDLEVADRVSRSLGLDRLDRAPPRARRAHATVPLRLPPPVPPVAGAVLILSAAFVGSVLVEPLLRRRDASLGRRSLLARVRHPALLATCAAAALGLAHAGAGAAIRAMRLDVVDVDPLTNEAFGWTHVSIARSRPGPLELALEGATFDVAPRGDSRPVVAQAGRSGGAERLALDVRAWSPVAAVARWEAVEAAPRTGLPLDPRRPPPLLQGVAPAALPWAGVGRARDLPGVEPPRFLAMAWREGCAGPALLADGEAVGAERCVTIVRTLATPRETP